MFDSRKQPCLRYVAVAFSFHQHTVAGYCNTARSVYSRYSYTVHESYLEIEIAVVSVCLFCSCYDREFAYCVTVIWCTL